MKAFDELIGCTDAMKWAKEFVKVAELRPDIPCDEGTMLCWFANAIMAGHDEGRQAEKLRGFENAIREIAFMAAGAGSGSIMERAPDVIMPSEEISARVEGILMEFGIEPEKKGEGHSNFYSEASDGEAQDKGPNQHLLRVR